MWANHVPPPSTQEIAARPLSLEVFRIYCHAEDRIRSDVRTVDFHVSCIWAAPFEIQIRLSQSREHGPSGNHFKAGSWSTFGSEVGSSQDLETIRSWISLCEAGHKHCCSANSPTDAFFPAKIIDVQDIPLGAVHLWDREYVQSQTRIDQTDAVTGKPLPSYPSYWALSHRWGCRNILKLSSSTEHQFRQGIAIEQLSPTFRDAAHLVHRLGYRYLWIDSICTFQDSNIDWQRKPTRWLMSTATHIAIYPPSVRHSTLPTEACFTRGDLVRDLYFLS